MSVTYIDTSKSPNFESGDNFKARTHHARTHRAVVIHKTEGTFPSDRDYLMNPAPEGNPDKAVSTTIYIRRNGDVYLMVDFGDIAWTQGLKESERTHRPDLWLLFGYSNPNYWAIGVELEALRGEPISPEQAVSLPLVLADLVTRFPLTADGQNGIAVDRTHILGHYEINNLKVDPDQDFPWDAILTRTKQRLLPPPPPPPPPAPSLTFAETGFTVQGGFLEYFLAHGGVGAFGYPLTNEEPHPVTPVVTRQVFENVQFEYNPLSPEGERIRLGAVGRLYLQRVGRIR